MTNLLAGPARPLALPAAEARLARDSGAALADFDEAGPPLTLRLENPQTGQTIETTVPATAIRVLSDVLAQMAKGQAVSLVPLHAELSTQQAADLLNVSRPYFIKLLEEGKMPFRKVGEQRRVRYDALLRYMDETRQAGNAALEEMTAEAERLGLYE